MKSNEPLVFHELFLQTKNKKIEENDYMNQQTEVKKRF